MPFARLFSSTPFIRNSRNNNNTSGQRIALEKNLFDLILNAINVNNKCYHRLFVFGVTNNLIKMNEHV